MGGMGANLGGTAGGAAAGAGIGSVFPGIGTALGAAIGAALGSGTATAATGGSAEKSLLNAGLAGVTGYGAGSLAAPALSGAASSAAGSAAPAAAGSSGLEGLSQFTIPASEAASQTIVPTGAASVLPAGGVGSLSEPIGSGLSGGAALNTAGKGGTAAASKMTGQDMLQNAFLATSIGGMLGNAIKPPPLYPPSGIPNAPIGHGAGFTPVATGASQQWAQLMAQRRAMQNGKFTS